MDISEIYIRVMTENDWALYKSLRLESLLESPDSFASSYEHESSYSDSAWKQKLDPNGRAFQTLPLVAFLGDSPSGLAWGIVDNQGDEVAHLYQMWVNPDHRGLGVGKALLSEIISWAQELSLRELALGVTSTNMAAVGLYELAGFYSHKVLEELKPGSNLKVQTMSLSIENGNV